MDSRRGGKNFDERRLEETTSDMQEEDEGLLDELLLEPTVGEVAAAVGEADDPAEFDEPSEAEITGRFARHSCSLPVYDDLSPPNNRDAE